MIYHNNTAKINLFFGSNTIFAKKDQKNLSLLDIKLYSMLEVNQLRQDTDKAIKGLEKRGLSAAQQLVKDVIALDDERKQIQANLDEHLSELNQLAKEIGQLFKSGEKEKAELAKTEVSQLKTKTSVLEDQIRSVKIELENKLLDLPNVPQSIVPSGTTEDDNEVYRDWTDPLPTLDDNALPHWELAERYKIFDLKTGAKISGSGFPLFVGYGAKLQRALVNFFLDKASEGGYLEMQPPLLVNEDSARGTGQLPDKDGQMYFVERDNLYLIPTAEVPLTNVYRDVILKTDDLPVKICGYTPCFRREAGSYGAHVKGLNRVHQFDKVEIVRIERPENSDEALMDMLNHVSGLLEALELPYRILRLCGGDLGFTAAITYDFEVYSAAQKRWLEVSSVSNFETYQTNRLKLRFKDEDGKNKLAHSLNGSALALARIVASILENHQTGDGIKIPKQLIPYTGFEWIK